MILIVGAGIAGLSLAYELAKRGAPVQVIDASGIAAGASGVATSYLEPRLGDTPVRLIEQEACRRWRIYVAQLEERAQVDCQWSGEGQIRVALDDDSDTFDEDIDQRRRAGWDIETLDLGHLKELMPGLASSVCRAALLRDVAWVNGRAVCEALAVAIEQKGGSVDVGHAVRALKCNSRSICVCLDDERTIEADKVVFCNGMGANRIQGLPQDISPCRAVRGVNLIVGPGEEGKTWTHMIKHRRGNFCPKPDGMLTVGTTYEAGEESLEVGSDIVERLYVHAERVLPDIRTRQLIRVDAGIRAKVADGQVHIGRSTRQLRVFFSLGHAGSGFLRAPVLAAEMSDFIIDGETRGLIAPLVRG